MSSKRILLAFCTALGVIVTVNLVGAERPGAPELESDDEGSLGSDSRVQRGLQIAPVPLDFKEGKRNLVGLGSYIVNAQGACGDCHTCPTYEAGHNPYQGGDGKINARNYLAGGVSFGPFTSANLTPDASGRPAGMTREEFMRTIRTGRDHEHPDEILQVMPWPVYRYMTDRDLRAVYAYLRAIPRAEPGECGGPGE